MRKKILLTSFTTWQPHQQSNASDDLLAEIARVGNLPYLPIFLRHLPVEVAAASQKAIAKIVEIQPDAIICCGMAESRIHLTVEFQARCGTDTIENPVDLLSLIAGTARTEISYDAGNFVCEGLYYSLLDYLQRQVSPQIWHRHPPCVFVHVPILTSKNLVEIVADFLLILQRLAQSD
jgi:pyroglutamyl-peptidase